MSLVGANGATGAGGAAVGVVSSGEAPGSPTVNITVRVSPGQGVAWPRVALQLAWPPALASSVMHRNWPREERAAIGASPPMRQR